MRRMLVLLGVMWIAANLVGAWLSVERELPYDLPYVDSPGDVEKIGDDWLYGWGSGLAMPLWVLAVAAVLTVVASFGGGATRLASILLVVVGAASIAYTLVDQPAADRLHTSGVDRGEAGVVFATLVLAGLLALLGVLTAMTTPRLHRR